MSNDKPREFWVIRSKHTGMSEGLSTDGPYPIIASHQEQIHVIEYSAYEKMQKAYEWELREHKYYKKLSLEYQNDFTALYTEVKGLRADLDVAIEAIRQAVTRDIRVVIGRESIEQSGVLALKETLARLTKT